MVLPQKNKKELFEQGLPMFELGENVLLPQTKDVVFVIVGISKSRHKFFYTVQAMEGEIRTFIEEIYLNTKKNDE